MSARVLPRSFLRDNPEPPSTVDLLQRGEIVFLPGMNRATSYYTRMRRLGYRLHQRATEQDGVKGIAVWAVKEEQS